MYIHVELKRSEIAANDKLIECIRDMIPEEAGIEIMSFEDVSKKLLENGAYHRENNFATFDIDDQGDDLIISLGIDEDFTVDTIKFLNKVVDAGSGLIGAFTGFLATMKILGAKFGKKVGSYFKDFSEKWNLIPESKFGVYGVVHYTFHYRAGEDVRKGYGASVVEEYNGELLTSYRMAYPIIDPLNPDFDEWKAAQNMAEDTALSDIKDDFHPQYPTFDAAKNRVDALINDYIDFAREEDANK